MWYIISVGGCGGMLHMTYLKYVKDLPGDFLWNIKSSDLEEIKKLFRGVKIEAEVEEAKGEYYIEKEKIVIDKNIRCYPLEDKERVKREGESKPYDCYYFIYRSGKIMEELGSIVKEKLGENFITGRGYSHHPEQQMLCLAVKKVKECIMSNIAEVIRKDKFQVAADGVIFFVGFGGGTGTGIIEEIVKKIRGEYLPALAVVVLSGKDDEKVQAYYYRRCFNSILALNNLLACGELTGVILIDNNFLNNKFNDVKEIDQCIIESIFPLFEIKEHFTDLRDELSGSFTPILIPCYHSGREKIEELFKDAIEEGKLGNCTDYDNRYDKYVFIRTNKSVEEELSKLDVEKEKIFHAKPIIGINEDEVLVLLKNPDMHNILSHRIENARNFAELIQKVAEKSGDDFSEAQSISVEDHDIKEILQEIKEGDRKKGQETAKDDDILNDAIKFLFPAEKEEPYKYMEELINYFVIKLKGLNINDNINEIIEELNNNETLEKLKGEFKDKKCSLKEPKVEVVKEGDEWKIVDGDREYTIQKEEDKLKIVGMEEKLKSNTWPIFDSLIKFREIEIGEEESPEGGRSESEDLKRVEEKVSGLENEVQKFSESKIFRILKFLRLFP